MALNIEKSFGGESTKRWFEIPQEGVAPSRDFAPKNDAEYAGRVKWDLKLKAPIYLSKAE